MIRRLLVIIVGISGSISGYTQHWLGLSSSNYAGTNALFLNPAHAADSRHKLYLNLIGNDLFLVNNYLRFDAPYSFLGLITNSVPKKYRSERGLIIWKESYYAERLNGKPKHLHAGGDVRGPSALFSFKNNRFAVALTTRGRYSLSLTDASEETARVIRYGTNLVELQNKPFTDQTAKLSTNGFVELGATFGAVLLDDETDFLKFGVTVKRLVGVYNVHGNMKDADYIINVESLNPEREFISASKLEATYGYTTEEAFSNLSLNPQFLFGDRSAGGGWGFDLGMVYEYRPDAQRLKIGGPQGGRHHDPNKNKYKYRISAALTDVGAIRYNNLNYVRDIDIDLPSAQFSYIYFNSLPSTAAAVSAVNESINVYPAGSPRGWTVGLPTSFNTSFDYHHKDNWYVNALWVQGLRGKNYLDIRPQSVFAVTPRYETKWFEVSTPLAMVDNYRVFTVGLAARVGPIIIGTDHLGGLLDIGKPQGLDFYFGLYAPFFHRKPEGPNKCWYQPYERSSRRKR